MFSIYPPELELKVSGLPMWWKPHSSGLGRVGAVRSQFPEAPEPSCFGSREKSGVN